MVFDRAGPRRPVEREIDGPVPDHSETKFPRTPPAIANYHSAKAGWLADVRFPAHPVSRWLCCENQLVGSKLHGTERPHLRANDESNMRFPEPVLPDEDPRRLKRS